MPVLYAAFYDSIAAHSRHGLNVVVDVAHYDRTILADCARRLDGLPVLFAGVRCPIEVIMERRNIPHPGREQNYARGTPDDPIPAPVWRWQREVHVPGIYDVEVDTSVLTPEACAAAIRARLDQGPYNVSAMGRADLHIHTRHGDGMATVPELLEHVARQGALDVIAITEHDTLAAAVEARDLHSRNSYSFDVIGGMEVTTLDGHLLALFIDEPVRSFQRIEPTLAEIHRLGGIAVAPHPLSWLTRSISVATIDRVAAHAGNDGVFFDAIEEHNMSPAGRIAGPRVRRLNRERLHLPALGSSDAHFLASVGTAHSGFVGSSAPELRLAIAAGTTVPVAGRLPALRELGYRNIVLQQWRGMMATPRNMGWAPTIRSFVTSRARRRPAPTRPEERAR
jgi:predicted metal-dependent phosphoesterase TrpH